jgi:hypothetical protein
MQKAGWGERGYIGENKKRSNYVIWVYICGVGLEISNIIFFFI